MQQGMERPWEQRPSAPRAQGTEKALTLASYREARAVKETLLLDLQAWGVTASAQEAMVRQRGSRAELPHLLLSFLTQQGSLSEESSGVCLWRQSKVGRQAQLGSGGNISGQVESKQHTLIPRGVAGEGTQAAV